MAILLTVITSCNSDGSSDAVQTVEPTRPGALLTPGAENGLPSSAEDINFITVVTDAPARFQEFGDIDPLGNVIGFDPGIMAALADAGINVRGVSGAALGRKAVLYFAFDNRKDADKARRIITKLL